MDFFGILLQTSLITSLIIVYLLFFKKSVMKKGFYKQPGWNYTLKLACARHMAVKRWRSQFTSAQPLQETPLTNSNSNGVDGITVRGSAPDGTTLLLGIRKVFARHSLHAEVTVHVRLANGVTYKLPEHPYTVIGDWVDTENGWGAKGLKIYLTETNERMRIIYNGLLTRESDNVTQHVRFNFVWCSATRKVMHPEDWSEDLAAQSLALEPWRDGSWHELLNNWNENSWMQWGSIQGRFHSFNCEGMVDVDEYLRLRGVRERFWIKHQAYLALRRSVTLFLTAIDGTAICLRGLSFKNVLTQCITGCVRLSSFTVQSVTHTDLSLPEFCETSDYIPKVFTLHVGSKKRNFKIVARTNENGGKLYSGMPCQHRVEYRTIVGEIDGILATGILELQYESEEKIVPAIKLTSAPRLKWLPNEEAVDVRYCLSFEDRAAACPSLVGGKGASLALLSSVQKEKGYLVPPGFCLTKYALDAHLRSNVVIKEAILEIEAASYDYEEYRFKEKCSQVVELFSKTPLTTEVKEDVLLCMSELRKKAEEQNLGPDIRFAVRSSAVGEDSEALSAAGQNDTILGCVSDDDVLKAIQRCWGSMFGFTSAYYRRQNGQECLCGGGVVVQALVKPRAAGVLFTRHPDAGDPSRLLVTANYGLGESVVSGSVEPDTVIISRSSNDELSIYKHELGAKTQRVTTDSTGGVTTEDVPKEQRGRACLTEDEALRLGRIGVEQDTLWGSGRDIEWAICEKDKIYLLQARPITSLERWTEEELLHEHDSPIMADDELTTFANTGEVLPRSLSPMSYDFVAKSLVKAMCKVFKSYDEYDSGFAITHNRVCILPYNTIYRQVPSEIDINIKMIEMSVHGHKVADQNIADTARRRRELITGHKFRSIMMMTKNLLGSKKYMNETIKKVEQLNINASGDDPQKVLDSLSKQEENLIQYCENHMKTTLGSTASQLMAMVILLEGASDFTVEQCNEICLLLSSGDVLSAEVPLGLAKLANQLLGSGKFEEFCCQDPKNAMQWLNENLPDVHKAVSTFLKLHGHRALMEFDLVTKPWALVPEDMMKVLQNMHVTSEEKQKAKSDHEIVSSLKTPKKSSTRTLLKWVLPLCRRAVRHRESTKGHLILAIHKLRLALIDLGKLLVRRWYLPDYDLIFYFRIHELKEYIETRDPALLKKAIQRRQYFPKWNKLKFREINVGWPEPIQTEQRTLKAGDVRIVGTSVCAGEVVGRCCVVKDLAEVGQLEQGDILITHSTDIGWSPYFPLLTGIVTELGGLISHGAVIAREYGLPCIVAATGATDIFKTGDVVRLSGTTGILEKVLMEENGENSLKQ